MELRDFETSEATLETSSEALVEVGGAGGVAASTNTTTWAGLPVDVLLYIYAFVGSAKDLHSCILVCRKWATAAYVERPWMALLTRSRWPGCKPKPLEFPWTYRELVLGKASLVDKNWNDGTFKVRTMVSQLDGKGVIDFIRVGPNRQTLVSCGLSRSLTVNNLSTGDRVNLPAHEHHVCALERLPGSMFCAASYDTTLSLWQLKEEGVSKVNVLSGHRSYVLGMKMYGEDGRTLVSRSRDQTLRVWDLESGTCSLVMKGHTESITGLKCIDGFGLVSSSRDGCVLLYDPRSGAKPVSKSPTPHSCDVYALRSLGNGIIASCSADHHIALWDIRAGSTIRYRTPEVGYCLGSGISEAGVTTLYAGGSGGSLMVKRDPFSQSEVVHCKRNSDWVLGSVKVIGKYVVSGSLDNSVSIWAPSPTDETQYSVKHALTLHSGVVRKVRASHFEVSTGGYDGKVCLLDFTIPRQQNNGDSAKCSVM